MNKALRLRGVLFEWILEMLQKNSWLLPEGIDQALPEEAAHLEALRRTLLDRFACWGYQLVIPPFVDFLDSLLIASGRDLDLQTFKVTDQISGETLGIRADMTPQVARMDAHNIKHEWPTRLCYTGTILHTHGDALEKSRSPMQIGAELYGHSGLESDLEIIRLMLEMLAVAGVLDVHLDLGHVGIYRGLSQQAGLSHEQELELFDVMQRKARPELSELLQQWAIDEQAKHMLLKLPELNGDAGILQIAGPVLAQADASVKQALSVLEALAGRLQSYFPSLQLGIDLAELRGYHYHTGVVFAAFTPPVGREIARGGRYDNIGAAFGRARPATGFSADLKQLAGLVKTDDSLPKHDVILAPYADDPALTETIRDLRAQGLAVIQHLPGQFGDARQMGCTSVLEQVNQSWVIRALN